MNLDFKFILAGTAVILLLIPLYIYRRQVFPFIYRGGNFKAFLINLKQYIHTNYPKINFNFDIVEKTIEEKDIPVRQMLVLENIVSQFSNFEYETQTQKSINKELLWSSYERNSKPLKEKYPNDWPRRKECVWNRDNGKCDRCGTKVKLVDAQITFVKSLRNGGGYNFENLVTLCSDCNKILNSSNIENTSKDLLIQEHIIKEVLR